MSKLYQVMYPGAYLPWGIVLLYYAFHVHVFRFLSGANYVLLAGLKLTHMEHFGRPVLYWSRMFTMSELSMMVRLIVLMETGSGVMSTLAMASTWFVLSRVPPKQQSKLIQAPLYCITLLVLSAVTTSWTQRICCLLRVCTAMYEYRTSWAYETYEGMEQKVSDYFKVKIADAYLMFLLEWSSSSLHWASLLVVGLFSVVFQVYACSEIDLSDEPSNLSDYYHNMHLLPLGYPVPLNFITSRDNCKVAKRVFKPHFI